MPVTEQPTKDPVDDAWTFLLERTDVTPDVRRMIDAAAARPAVRRLLPYLSLGYHLRLSRRAECPSFGNHPSLTCFPPHSPKFELRAAGGATVAEGDLEHLLDLLVGLLEADQQESVSTDDGQRTPDWASIIAQLDSHAIRAAVCRRARYAFERWFVSESDPVGGWTADEVAMEFYSNSLTFSHAVLPPFVDTYFKLRARNGREIGYYQLITDLDGEPDDDYLVFDVDKDAL